MLSSRPKTSIILDIRRIKKDGRYPVKLRVTFERKQKYYSTNHCLTEREFERTINGERQTSNEKELKWSLQAYETKAAEVIKNIGPFSWKDFEKDYLSNRLKKASIADGFERFAKQLRSEERVGTAVSYECAAVSFNKFSSGAKYSDISVDWLHKYERWMLNQGNSITTVGIYTRGLRTILNIAITDKLFHKELYPFGKKKYEIPTGKNNKKALTIEDLGAIFHYPTLPGTTQDLAKDYWLFLYLSNGMNMKDMCQLKYENIKGKFLEFERAKSERTKREVEKICVPLTDDIKAIILKHGNKANSPGNYIFPILSIGQTAERKYQLIQQITGLVNDYIKAIARHLKIENKVTTYVARHSFATILKRSGVSTEFIKDALGHSTVSTTENYLASFNDDIKIEAAKALTAFRKNNSLT